MPREHIASSPGEKPHSLSNQAIKEMQLEYEHIHDSRFDLVDDHTRLEVLLNEVVVTPHHKLNAGD